MRTQNKVRFEEKQVRLSDLSYGMLLAEDIRATNGLLIITRGYRITQSIRARLMNFAEAFKVRNYVSVLVPVMKVR